MTSQITLGKDYIAWLSELKEKIRDSQLRAGLKVNAEMLALYWELGRSITEKQAQSNWGDKIIQQLSKDLCSAFSQIPGFSLSNLKYIRKWYLFYSTIGQQPVGQLQKVGNQFPAILGVIPWGHHIQIITQCKTIPEALFYVQETTANNWARTVLVHQIESRLYNRSQNTQHNFSIILPKPQSDLASELIKNTYNLSFLGLRKEVSERELENALTANIKRFMLELGTGFSFLGQQYHLQISDKDYYIDLLFYHTRLHCYFAIELKVDEFKPEYAGKLEFYITALDEQMKMPADNPTIGLMLCKTTDKVTVEYSLKSKVKPIGIAKYHRFVPKEWKDELPDEEVLRQELEKEIQLSQNPVDRKIHKLKVLMGKLNDKAADLEKDPEIINKIFYKLVKPLIREIDKRISAIKSMFNSVKIEMIINEGLPIMYNSRIESDEQLRSDKNLDLLALKFSLEGFKSAGTKVFSVCHKLELYLDRFIYQIGIGRADIWNEWVYRQIPDKEQLEKMADRFVETILDDIFQKTEALVSA